MDINDVRSLMTVAGLVCFVLIVVWAYSSSARCHFEEAAMLPFDDDNDVSLGPNGQTRQQNG